ncbi:uncharacterized protein LOC113207518 isoform X1 [Frankliniella occidentalis]|uniref:Uncharacterized protein LOC113207518 isoform X1 n=1 Tax=Frankliniella occidentalis TaxID=133901 RepID=A0A9C6U191_FRAOC|nr:uncharacterized protein LOC113207518 isoform X1 [Frankliniella occidentalis]
MELDGDIGVAEQLGAEAEQCLSLLARRMQLHEMKLDALSAREEAARLEVAQLTRSIKLRKDMEATYTREAAAAREELSEKSYLFQELTRRASERLSTRALQLETARLEARTRDLQAKERALQRELGAPVDEAAVQALLQEVQGLHRRFEKVSSEHERARALALSSVQEASDVRAVRVRRQREEAEYHRLLEEAVEDMTLLLVEDELSAGVMDDGAAGDGVAAAAAILEKGASSEVPQGAGASKDVADVLRTHLRPPEVVVPVRRLLQAGADGDSRQIVREAQVVRALSAKDCWPRPCCCTSAAAAAERAHSPRPSLRPRVPHDHRRRERTCSPAARRLHPRPGGPGGGDGYRRLRRVQRDAAVRRERGLVAAGGHARVPRVQPVRLAGIADPADGSAVPRAACRVVRRGA